MRTLVIGIPLPHVSFDNYSFVSAPSLSEYRRLVIEMEAVSRAVEAVTTGSAEHATFAGQPVVNGPGSSRQFGLGELLHMRRTEAEQFFATGSVAVCIAYPDASHSGIVGLPLWRRYEWLPEPSGFSYGRDLLPGFGRPGASLTDEDHALAPLVLKFGASMAYRAYLSPASGAVPGVRVFARSAGGLPVGFELPLIRGKIIFLPPMPEFSHDRMEIARTLFHSLAEYDGGHATPLPEWLHREVS